MPVTFTVTVEDQAVTLEVDSGTKPATTGHYLIQRRPNGAAASDYLTIYKTTSATVYDHPRPRDTAGTTLTDTQLLWAYRAYSYITATSTYDTAVEDDNSGSGFGIPTVVVLDITSTGVAEPTTSAGTMSNTYLAQAETAPTNAYDKDSWTTTKVIPLAASSA